MGSPVQESARISAATEQRIQALLAEMTLVEKIGQMTQIDARNLAAAGELADGLRAGRIGSVINQVDVTIVNELQRIAVEESRLGIPLLVGRDVIHGFKTVLPIPLGQAATWNPALVEQCARVAALEAAAAGINWTFAPMVDISRDPRWGRIAESFGEDPWLSGWLAVAMIRGFQGENPAADGAVAACAKHFAGYGAAESGRDYATTNIPENELRNVYLQPFKASVDAGVISLMTSFSELDGIPATASEFLLRRVLRDEWAFDGLVVSDWDSVRQLRVHGLTDDDAGSAEAAATAGVDMEMAGDTYQNHLARLVEEGRVGSATIDAAAANVLRAKFRLGLFERPYTDPARFPPPASDEALSVAHRAALESIVLLKNDGQLLPLSPEVPASLAVIGPLADAPYEQLGTWIFDGDPAFSVTPLGALREQLDGRAKIRYVRAMETSRSGPNPQFDAAVEAARASDVAILCLGEESILSGEAHSRADIGLPGGQAELLRRVAATGTPIVAVILAGRPLTVGGVAEHADALLYSWHPGTMCGPALVDLLLGREAPSGKLPVTFPRMVGQVPIYYNRKNSGKPPSPETVVHLDEIEVGAPQTSLGMSAFHLDAGYLPLYPFGFGLSYTEFDYRDIRTSAAEIRLGERITISAELTNTGDREGVEVAQLYVRDLVGNVTRPIRELKGFRRVRLAPAQTVTVNFDLHTDDLAFYGRDMRLMTEAGAFHAWIGGSSETDLRTEFRIVEGD